MTYRDYELLRSAFEKLMSEYADIFDKVCKEHDWKNSFRDVISKEIPSCLKECAEIEDPYLICGSYGKGRWTSVPWIAIFDKRITVSAQKGVYIVYLLNKDSKELYLTFEIAATEASGSKTDSKGNIVFAGVVGKNDPKMKHILKERSDVIRSEIQDDFFNKDDNIRSGSSGYDFGAVYYKKYTLNDLPDGVTVVDDLKKMMKIYQMYYDKFVEKIKTSWEPAITEYDPGITKEKWLELLSELAGPVWGGVLAMFYTEKEGATCSAIADKFNMKPMEVSGRCTQLAKRVHKETNCPLYKDVSDKDRYWPILFFGKEASAEEKGNFVWKLRPELYDALTEFGILRFLPEKSVDKRIIDFNLSPKDAVDHIKSYISSKGFTFAEGLIDNFYLSLKSKPFVILAGTSGTGKTKLVELFAEAIGAEYSLVSVRPDWSDGSDLFGHNDLNGQFINGPICEAFDKAIAELERPIFLCLDEMNLARVEYYLSDFLSVIESRKKGADGKITTKPIAQFEDGIPDNLYFVGTVNMDETTFPFSKKVLDRANTI